MYVTDTCDGMIVPLSIDPQSLDAVTVSIASVKKAFATGTGSIFCNDAVSYPYYRSAHRLPNVSASNVQTLLEGQMPGVLITSTTGVPGGSSYMSVRGQASLLNGVAPYYVVDGVPSAAGDDSVSYIPSGNASRSLSPLNPVAPGDI